MNRVQRSVVFLLLFVVLGFAPLIEATVSLWGFYGHRKINRMAIFSLPQEMLGFYKKNIEYITEHAVDPDKRRYATKLEAVRHYIDVDHWGQYPFDNVPRRYSDAIIAFSGMSIISDQGDTTLVDPLMHDSLLMMHDSIKYYLTYRPDANPWTFTLSDGSQLYIEDQFSEFGILPYWLKQYQYKLVKAFKLKDEKKILRISAEIGHYIGDAHVPLHTTENYNGAMTDQVGIHAFWESRVPELFADEEYDFFVGKAEYIDNVAEYFWKVVLESHLLLEDVLKIEKDLSRDFPQDKQWCYDERLKRTIRTQCKEYAKAYADKMDGMVEKRMRDAILSLSSLWYTAWIDAGQPDLSSFEKLVLTEGEKREQMRLDKIFKGGDIKGREHDNGKDE